MQRLEESFQSSSNQKTRRLIQDQFRGEYSYVTTCCNCSKESERQSYFYELELKVKNCNSILDSLQEFLNEEPLTGDNKYFCSNCNEKQNAFTRIKLEELPPVLQLQLLRYEIDSTIGTRRKIHSAIQFPDVLDMSSYLGASHNSFNYKLIAVLMHGGSTAYSGHYYAHINTADSWHVFDDINVKKEKDLNLTSEENLIPIAERKICGPKLKGFRSSSSVYMLVYRRIDQDDSSEISSTTDIKKSYSAISDVTSGHFRKNNSTKCVEGTKSQERSFTRRRMGRNFKTEEHKNEYNGSHLPNPENEALKKNSSTMNCNFLNKGSNKTNSERETEISVQKDKDSIILTWLAKIKDNDKLNQVKFDESTKPLNNFIWSKLTSFEIDGDIGDIFLVFDPKIFNHPLLKTVSEETLNNTVNGALTEDSLKGKMNLDGMECKAGCSESYLRLGNKFDILKQSEYPDSESENVLHNTAQDPNELSIKEGADVTVHAEAVVSGNSGGSDARDPDDSFTSAIEFRTKLDEEHWKMLPNYLKRAILKSRDEVRSNFNSQLIEIDSRIDAQTMVKNIAESIVPDTGSNDYEFINFEWLKLIGKSSVPPVDNASLLCKHGKLSMENTNYKVISIETANFIFEKFGGGPRLKSDSLCQFCVENKARQVKLQMEVAKDSKLLPGLLKIPIEKNQKAYWVGKRSLRNWANYVLSVLDEDGIEDDEDTELLNTSRDGSGGEDGKKDASDNENIMDLKNNYEEELNEAFNDDIICIHDGMTVEENDRKLISEVVWNMFLKYFPKAKAFERDQLPCVPCQNLANQDREHRDAARKRAMNEKEFLKDLFEKKVSCDLSIAESGTYLVDSAFMVKWRKYIRSIQRQTMLDAPRWEDLNTQLLCHFHKLLLYDPEVDIERFNALNETEWRLLKSFYPTEVELKVVKNENGGLMPSIEVCQECLTQRRLAEAEQDLKNSYVNASIYVWKMHAEGCDSEDNYESSTKKRKLNNGKVEDVSVTEEPCKKLEKVRRSARARQPKKGKKRFLINQFTTLKDLKIMIFNKFTVMPTDQHLSLNGVDLDTLKESLQLTDTDATLIRLKVKPNDVIHLVADEPTPGLNICESEAFLLPEAGFKGTELGGR